MSRALDLRQPVVAGLIRLLEDESASAAMAAFSGDASLARRIHKARRACKKIRATLYLFSIKDPAHYQKADNHFRNAAAALSQMRDAEALCQTLGILEKKYFSGSKARLRGLRNTVLAQREETLGTPEATQRALARFGRKMRSGSRCFQKLDAKGDFKSIADALEKSYRRVRRRFRRAYRTMQADDFHKWRKAVKMTAYYHGVFRAAWPPIMKALRRSWNSLADLLGKEHDFTALETYLGDTIGARGGTSTLKSALKATRREREGVRATAKQLGQLLLNAKPKDWRREWQRRWKLAAQSCAQTGSAGKAPSRYVLRSTSGGRKYKNSRQVLPMA